MRRLPGYASLLLLAGALIAPVTFTGCSAHASGTIKGTSNMTTPIDRGTGQPGNNVQEHNGATQASQ
jgi:hypothetical protein